MIMNRFFMPADKTSTIIFSFIFLIWVSTAYAQEKHMVQVKTYDQQLQPVRNIEVSINGQDYITISNKGVGFAYLSEHELPLKSVKIKSDDLEAASWNYSKGIVEIVIRKKNFRLIQVVIRNRDNTGVGNLKVEFKGQKPIVVLSNSEGRFEMPLALDEKITSADQFSIAGYKVIKLDLSENENILTIHPIQSETLNSPVAKAKVQPGNEYFRNFDLSKLDSIQSLTVFYAIFKNYDMKNLSESAKRKVDAKFNQLVHQLQDSVRRSETTIVGRISDSSFVADDVKNLLQRATHENEMLELQRADFDEKIQIITDKLAGGIENLDAETRKKLLSDLTLLEQILVQNENRFYKNQNDYREIVNSLKEKYFDVESLENKLSESEAQRLEEQVIFTQRLLATLFVVLVFAILTILLVSFSNKLRKQKKELELANSEVQRINENLENLVAQRTKLLESAHKELDTFLYRASHDLRSPVCSIIGLCNIAILLSNGESKELIQKVVNTTIAMDKLLKKLSIISEINQPTNFSPINLMDMIENIRGYFNTAIINNRIKFEVNCPQDLIIYSYPNLIEAIFVNLIDNAVFYTAIKQDGKAKIELTVVSKNNEIEITVYDSGIGLDNAIRERLFDMFFKGNENSKGNGLGLYIVQKSVHALNGTITLESEPTLFSKFVINLPLQAAPRQLQSAQHQIEFKPNAALINA